MIDKYNTMHSRGGSGDGGGGGRALQVNNVFDIRRNEKILKGLCYPILYRGVHKNLLKLKNTSKLIFNSFFRSI